MHEKKIVSNGKIWTGTGYKNNVEALALNGERIVAVGSLQDCRDALGGKISEIDLNGKLLIPGFCDAHSHLLLGGYSMLGVDFAGVDSVEEFCRRVANKNIEKKSGWLTGCGWDHYSWEGNILPHKNWIDAITDERPMFVTRSDVHMGLANTAALRIAGIDKNTPSPDGGEIVRDSDGEPTGILKDRAMELLEKFIPKATNEDADEVLTLIFSHLAEMGITSVHETCVEDKEMWEQYLHYKRWHDLNKLTSRVGVRTGLASWRKQKQFIDEFGQKSNMLKFIGVKDFIDGSLGSSTAWFEDEYLNAAGCKGFCVQEDKDGFINEIVNADKEGIQVSLHAIGDMAVNMALNIAERLERDNGKKDRRFRIEHAQHLLKQDIERMSRLKIIASVQPYHFADDGRWMSKALGEERCKLAYAFNTFLNNNIVLAFGSDWPVAPVNPLLGIAAAVSRRTLDKTNHDAWQMQEQINVIDALVAYTSGGAFAEYAEDEKGKLLPGYLADMVVLSDDILSEENVSIENSKVCLTMVGGNVVYESW